MRDENPLPLTERFQDDEKKDPKSRYFLGFEGAKTEIKYFNEIILRQKKLGISSIIEFHPLSRQNEETNLSHPNHAIPLFIQALEEYATGSMTVKSVADHFIEWLHKNHYICGKKSATIQKEQKKELLRILKEEGYAPSDEIHNYSQIEAVLDKNLNRLCSSVIRGSNIHEFSDILRKQKVKYDKKYDFACFFMDRDELSVTPSDFEEARRLCEKNHISLYISNPRFEFWLLLHFLSRDMMDLEEVQNPHSTYLERRLGEILKERNLGNGYTKTSYKAEAFADRELISEAIMNESAFCETCNDLCENVGCNIGLLMNTLLRSKDSDRPEYSRN